MSEEDLKFCEDFEEKSTLHFLLNSLETAITEKGFEAMVNLKKYLAENLDRYLELTNVS
jgi:hypothetical protein